ncbi:MAG: hypothetical protein EA343_09505 [Nodularia sp. (in: Bacteria)]|nr:MAG: hypothetical protein EA343_09505 [Nodularia sp. (in: cyanobacteria)]
MNENVTECKYYLGSGFVPDFSRHLENAILSFSQTIIFTLAIFIKLELLIISLWKKLRSFPGEQCDFVRR